MTHNAATHRSTGGVFSDWRGLAQVKFWGGEDRIDILKVNVLVISWLLSRRQISAATEGLSPDHTLYISRQALPQNLSCLPTPSLLHDVFITCSPYSDPGGHQCLKIMYFSSTSLRYAHITATGSHTRWMHLWSVTGFVEHEHVYEHTLVCLGDSDTFLYLKSSEP